MDVNQKSGPKVGENSKLWIAKVLAGVLIIFVLGLHLYINHLVAPGGLLSWQDVVLYYQNPVVPILEGLFLFLVLGHAALGVRSITLDLNLSPRKQSIIDWIIIVVTVAFLAYGLWVLINVALL